MKNLLILFVTISYFTSIDAQTFDLLNEDRLQTLQTLNQNQSKISTRDIYKTDSTHFFNTSLDNLSRRRLFFNHNAANNYGNAAYYFYTDGVLQTEYISTQTFNTDGTVAQELQQQLSNGQYLDFSKIENSYDSNGNLITIINSSFNPIDQEFVPALKWDYSFDNSNNEIERNVYYWDASFNEWTLSRTTVNTFVNGLLIESISYNYFAGQLNDTYKTENTFNLNNELEYYIVYSLSDNMEWEEFLRANVTYPDNLTQNFSEELFIDNVWTQSNVITFVDYPDIPKLHYRDIYSPNGNNELEFYTRFEYFYSQNPLDTDNEIDENLSLVVANPFSQNDVISIDGITPGKPTTFSLMDISGNMVMKIDLKRDHTFQLNTVIPNGTYIISLSQNNQVVLNRKIVKIK